MTPGPEEFGGLPCSGEDDPIHLGMAHQVLTGLVFLDVDELQDVTRDPGFPQALGDDGAAVASLRGGLEQHRGPSSQG